MNRIQMHIIKEALESPEALSEWEYDFINNIAAKDDCDELTKKQNAILNRIGSKMAEQ